MRSVASTRLSSTVRAPLLLAVKVAPAAVLLGSAPVVAKRTGISGGSDRVVLSLVVYAAGEPSLVTKAPPWLAATGMTISSSAAVRVTARRAVQDMGKATPWVGP